MKALSNVAIIIFGLFILTPIALAQYQGFRNRNQPIPPEAWLNMDSHAPMDPRIQHHLTRKQAAQKKAAERQQKLNQAIHRYNQSELRRASRLHLYDSASQVAIRASAQYLALREVDGYAAANQWLCNYKAGLNQRIRMMETPNSVMGQELFTGMASLGTGAPHISNYPNQLDELKRIRMALAKLGR